ncbi:cell wall hydrolase [Clostridium chromiireducens]|uniref:Cell wall hydrolase n=1 Tax=Clostridium chromiireducens TaxID=225345 RepID=A0A1V4J1Y8_9CLOT|nr:cell wall hydrolase [Clostridium chromiireducens]MVX62802.1 cell wall hydrolase [Clostridium chromiireducens]OPJ66203.1 spore cortex-lytic enzyme precursor [Clostridium chromiireducens]RII32702.1 cell wall hydrolase [Clostridium chromiireducens]
MKKKCSIFVTALILYLSVINVNPTFAVVLGETSSGTNNISINQKTVKDNLNTNINSQSNEKHKDVLEVFNHNTQQLYITGEDIELMAKLVSAESAGEPYAGKVAVASVVLNRTTDPHFPNTIKDVIFQKNAFSCVKNGKINANANQDCYNAVYDAIRGTDPTNDALFFYNPAIATCSWMKETQKINQTTIGHHTFFKTKA